jgi:hypothetical protein
MLKASADAPVQTAVFRQQIINTLLGRLTKFSDQSIHAMNGVHL